ncbi:hypothetical protein BX24_18535 [Escherichia coli O91:H21 str. 2009C-4646]|nr:hypothetical protein BX24_18535 [Escherichia coli O91:H21 str. 2009C-4646]
MTIIEAEGFLKLISAPAVTLDQPFGLFFSAWGMLVPVSFKYVRTPPPLNGRIDFRIVGFYMLRHRVLR